MLIVVALGGNAVSPPDREGNIAEQFAATRAVARPLADWIAAGHRLVITHGNGPQVGQVMRRVEIAAQHHVYPLPLDIVVADTEAGMGYMICQCLMNELASRGLPRTCTTLITTVRVDPDDPAMLSPTKPVGPSMTRDQADKHRRNQGWTVREDAGRGWRRVVPSPRPREIIEIDVVRTLVTAGHLVVAAGGGGIPVLRDEQGNWRGLEAVIDKDLTSALLAAQLGAEKLVILTAVEHVERDFGTAHARAIHRMTVQQARRMLEDAEFAPGSMRPKIEAAVHFLEHSPAPDREVLITSCQKAADALAGITGTRIVLNDRLENNQQPLGIRQ